MFTRVVEIKTKPGKAREVCNTVHDKILSTLKAQPGLTCPPEISPCEM
jgi:hypothetical protein